MTPTDNGEFIERRAESQISLIEYGRLLSQVDKLIDEVRTLRTDVNHLNDALNHSRGALKVMLALSAALGMAIGWLVAYFKP